MTSKERTPKWEKTGPESLKFEDHPTYVKFGSNLELSRCEDKCCGCSRVHCPFCNIHIYKPARPARVRDHLNQSHFKHAVLHQGKDIVIVKCYMQCVVAPGHFHCPYCPKQLLKKAGFLYHLRSHLRKAGKSVSLVQAPDFKQPEKILFDGHVIQLCSIKCEGTLSKHYHCPLCGMKSFEDMGPLSDHLWRCREVAGLAEQTTAEPPSKQNTEDLWSENILVSATAPTPKERFGDECHKSVVRNVSDLPLSRCEKSACCRRRFHCALCSESKFKPAFLSHMQEHYLSHWNNRADCGVYSCLVCYLPCLPRCGVAAYHFHCPKCGLVRRRKSQFLTHLEECMGADMEKDKGLYGNDDTPVLIDETDIPVEEPPGGVDARGGDNSLGTPVISFVDVTIEEVEPQTLVEVNDDAAVTMETSEPSLPSLDVKRVWEVFDTVSAHLSSEFLSALELQCPLEEFLNTVSSQHEVEVISSPGVNGNPVYSLTGTWENISKAKHNLRMKLPESLVRSMHDRDLDKESSQGNLPTEIQDVQTVEANPNSKQGLFADLQSDDVGTSCPATAVTPDAQEMTVSVEDITIMCPSSMKSVLSRKMSEFKTTRLSNVSSTGHSATNSTSLDKEQSKSFEKMSTRSKGLVETGYVPTALDMLSSAIEIINKEEADEQSKSVPATRGRKRKKKIQNEGESKKESKRICSVNESTPGTDHNQESTTRLQQSDKDVIQSDISTPTGRRYSTRGTKVDFSLLATGKKRKEKKPQPVMNLVPDQQTPSVTSVPEEQTSSVASVLDEQVPCVPEEKTPSVASSESWTQTVDDDYDSDECSDIKDLDVDVEDTAVPASQKLVFSTLAVIPVVTFDMQSKSMTKILSKQLVVPVKQHLPKIHSCPLCEFETSAFFELIQHCAAEHDVSEVLHCEECLVICLNDAMKEEHVAKFHEKKQGSVEKDGMHKCPKCNFVSTDFSEVTDHMIYTHNTESLRCDVCERVFSKHKSLDIHLTVKHGPRLLVSSRSEKNLTKCKMCPFNGEDFRALTSHLITVHNISTPTRCDVCERVFDKETELEVHLKKQHGPSEEQLSANRCSICGMLCKSRKTLSMHQLYIHKKAKPKAKDDIRLQCKACYFTAETAAEIREHRLIHRTGVLKCQECDMTFQTKPNLQFHVELHHQKSLASCEICGKVFKHKRYIVGHMKRHVGQKKYTCEDCGKTFYEKCAMKVHQEIHKTTDDRQYRYICSFCGKRYNSKSNLSDHLNKHTGEKPYKCELCDKTFGFRSQLAQHKIFIHSTDRPFKCSQCEKSFKLASRLQQHMIVHSGTAEHCELCGRKCSSATALKNHLKKCRLGMLKKPRIAIQPDSVAAADSLLEMPVDSYVIVNTQDTGEDLQQLAESQEVTGQQIEAQVFACSVCKQEFEYYQSAFDHINSAHEESGTDGQTDTVVLTEDSLPHGAVIKIEEDGQQGVSMAVGTFDY